MRLAIMLSCGACYEGSGLKVAYVFYCGADEARFRVKFVI